jgi:hypothetical protein
MLRQPQAAAGFSSEAQAAAYTFDHQFVHGVWRAAGISAL